MTVRDRLARIGAFAAFCGQAAWALPGAARRPAAFAHQLYHLLLGSLPVAAVAGVALGVVVWLQLRGLLFRVNAVDLLPGALAVAVVWELGPITAGLIAAGRIGAGLAAELAAMRVSEQLDAVEVLGLSPLRRLVAPRVLACLTVLPFLTILIDHAALLSSFTAEAVGGTMTWAQYRQESLRYLHLSDVIPATLKTVVFGFLIGAAGCWCGMTADGGTEGVGRAATKAVVRATLLVLVADVVLVRLIQLAVGPARV